MSMRRRQLAERTCGNCGKLFVTNTKRKHDDCPRCVEVRRVNPQDGIAQLRSTKALELLDAMVADECAMPWERRYNRRT